VIRYRPKCGASLADEFSFHFGRGGIRLSAGHYLFRIGICTKPVTRKMVIE